jgi:hypothetical protein
VEQCGPGTRRVHRDRTTTVINRPTIADSSTIPTISSAPGAPDAESTETDSGQQEGSTEGDGDGDWLGESEGAEDGDGDRQNDGAAEPEAAGVGLASQTVTAQSSPTWTGTSVVVGDGDGVSPGTGTSVVVGEGDGARPCPRVATRRPRVRSRDRRDRRRRERHDRIGGHQRRQCEQQREQDRTEATPHQRTRPSARESQSCGRTNSRLPQASTPTERHPAGTTSPGPNISASKPRTAADARNPAQRQVTSSAATTAVALTVRPPRARRHRRRAAGPDDHQRRARPTSRTALLARRG